MFNNETRGFVNKENSLKTKRVKAFIKIFTDTIPFAVSFAKNVAGVVPTVMNIMGIYTAITVIVNCVCDIFDHGNKYYELVEEKATVFKKTKELTPDAPDETINNTKQVKVVSHKLGWLVAKHIFNYVCAIILSLYIIVICVCFHVGINNPYVIIASYVVLGIKVIISIVEFIQYSAEHTAFRKQCSDEIIKNIMK